MADNSNSSYQSQEDLIDSMTKVCICNGITKKTIKNAIDNGIDSLEKLKETIGTGTGGCKGKRCTERVLDLIRQGELKKKKYGIKLSVNDLNSSNSSNNSSNSSQSQEDIIDGITKVCICKGISKKTIKNAINEGSDSLDKLREKIGTGTGGCKGRRCTEKILVLIRQAELKK